MSSNIFQDMGFWTLLAVLGLYLIQFYKWLWAKLKVMEAKRAEKKAEERKRKQSQASTNISPDDAQKLMALLQTMNTQKKKDEEV